MTDEESSVRLRSIYVSDSPTATTPAADAGLGWMDDNTRNRFLYGKSITGDVPRAAAASGVGGVDNDDYKDNDDDDGDDDELENLFESEPEPVSLPESTHSLFFTHRVCSIPWGYAFGITVISVTCLIMALSYNLEDPDAGNPLKVPANVSPSVKIAQYLSILIALLMEEEIPTGLQLLRTIPRSSFKEKFPNQSYGLFVFSSVLRIILGYLFLINVFVILVQATAVLDIFYDVLALQFISELDDIGFALAKMEVLGKRLQRACTARLFQTEFEKKKFKRIRAISIFLKSVYFVNLAAFLTGMIWISSEQQNNKYQCQEIIVDFGEGVWTDPVIVNPYGIIEDFTLVFSYFNGVYKQTPDSHLGRPVYREMKKFNGSEPFDDIGMYSTIPAEIKYSSDAKAWIFTHPWIKKSKDDDSKESWLLRSPETDSFDLLDVEKDWSIWLGQIETSRVSISCTKCSEDTDCNLNGVCNSEGKCECKKEEGVQYLGTHCAVKLKDECGQIKTEEMNDNSTAVTYTIQYYSRDGAGSGPADTLFQQYERPVYWYVDGGPFENNEGDINWLLYTGRRWFGMLFNLQERNMTFEALLYNIDNFHAFWQDVYSEATIYVSDPTTGDNPVGVDFYLKGETNNNETNQFGPFGALYSLQKDGQEGRGIWRCAGPAVDPFARPTVNSTD